MASNVLAIDWYPGWSKREVEVIVIEEDREEDRERNIQHLLEVNKKQDICFERRKLECDGFIIEDYKEQHEPA